MRLTGHIINISPPPPKKRGILLAGLVSFRGSSRFSREIYFSPEFS